MLQDYTAHAGIGELIAAVYWHWALKQWQEGEVEGGLTASASSTDFAPDKAKAWILHGMAADALGRSGEAHRSMDRALGLVPDRAIFNGMVEQIGDTRPLQRGAL